MATGWLSKAQRLGSVTKDLVKMCAVPQWAPLGAQGPPLGGLPHIGCTPGVSPTSGVSLTLSKIKSVGAQVASRTPRSLRISGSESDP